MSSLSMMETDLPPGFRFHPTDNELICDYLMKRLASCEEPSVMIDVDLNKCEPWDIPETACVGGNQWYFYSQQDRKYATGIRANRATASGYWKATGKDRPVVKKGRLVGMRKTLVFHQGRAPKGRKTDWVMHEFRLEGLLAPPKLPSSSKDQDWVVCRVFNKSREGPAKPTMSQATTSYSRDVETDSLPALADSYSMIFFDQTPQTTITTNAATNHDIYDEQVPCFSISNPDEANPWNFPQLFNMEDPNSRSMIIAPSIGISHRQDEILATSTTATGSFSAGDEHVAKDVLSQLTKMEDSTACNMKSSSPRSIGEVVSSESYLCDHVDLATIWRNHYY